MNVKTSNKITYVNFILSILIIWHHTYNVNVYSLSSGFFFNFQNIMLNLCEIAVPLFFFLSAFLFYLNLSEKNIVRKLKSRIFSLVIPYLVWNLIGYIYFQIISLFPFISNNYGGNIEPFSVVGMLKQSIIGDYNLVTWFLRTLIVYTFVFAIFYKLFKKKLISLLLFVFSLVMIIFAPSTELYGCACFYCLGIYLSTSHKSIVLRDYSRETRYASMIILFCVLLYFSYGNVDYMSFLGRVIYIIMGACLWIVFDLLKTNSKPKWYHKQNLIYYCGHEMVLEPVEKIIYLLLGSTLFGAIIDYVFAPIISILLIVLFSMMLRKIPFVYNLLIGFRKN